MRIKSLLTIQCPKELNLRMDTTYRLIVSVALHWRSYLMSSDVNIFSPWIDMEMVKLKPYNY